MKNSLIKNTNKAKSIVFYIVIGLVIGLLTGKIVPSIIKAQQVEAEALNEEDQISVVFGEIVDMNEMIPVSRSYSEVNKNVDQKEFFNLFKIPFTENSYWYRYVGTIKIGVDLSKAELIERDDEHRKIVIQLEQPYIASNTPDLKESGVLEENNNILNPIKVEKTDAFRKKCMEVIENKATSEGTIFIEARENTERNLDQLFNMGLDETYEIKIDWLPPQKTVSFNF